ncbi:MAG: LamG domain-containing protein, partial [Planctomycetota bacterium]
EEGTVYFDDIRLQPPRCFPEYGPAGDFTGDCSVDEGDLSIIVADWCKSGGWGPGLPVIEYRFEEGTGTTVANTGTFGSGYDLTIGLNNKGNPEPNNDPCWVNDTDPCRGWTLWFDGANDVNCSDYLAIPAMNLNSNTVSMTAWIKPSRPQTGSFTGLLHHSVGGGDTGVAGMSYGSGANWVYDGSFAYVWNENDQKTWGFESDIFIPEQEWSFVALVIEPDKAILYQKDLTDPNLLNAATNTLAHLTEEFDDVTFIAGDSRGGLDRFFAGQMDDVRIYDYSLTPDDVNDLSNNIPVSGIVYKTVASLADLCVGNKNPTDPCAPVDDQIDLCDYSKFADEWLETKLWPEP